MPKVGNTPKHNHGEMRKTKVYNKSRIERTAERMQRRVEENKEIDYYLKLWDIATEALKPDEIMLKKYIVEDIEKIAQTGPNEAEELFNEMIKNGMITETIVDSVYRLTLTIETRK